jgi:ABC-type oligopeptide transport system ATPase subunit
MSTTIKKLHSNHSQHLSLEGFSDELIEKFTQDGIIESLTPDEAYKAGFSVAIDNKSVTGGLKFNFSPTFSQLRLDDREIFKKDNGNGVTYLSLGGAVNLDCAYIPDGCRAITEGMKDALAFTHIGGIPTGAVAGVSHATKALTKNCKYTIIFDHDAWSNFDVFISLIRAGVHCNGKVAIIPEIEGYPKAGGCEYFKSGKTPADYQQLLDSAQSPISMFDIWFERQEITDVKSAVTLAVQAGKLMGEIYGYADAVTVEAIKDLLKNSKLSEWNLTTANIIRDSYNTQKSLKAKEKAEDETDTRNAVKIAIEIIKERADLFHSPSPDSTEYADIPSKTGVMTTHAISSREFKSWVTGEFYRDIGEGLTNESMNTVLATIHAIAAHDSPELPVSEQRIAAHDGRYYLYLADENQTVVEYSGVGWNICQNSPVKFVFDKYKAALPVPQRQGSIDKLWDIVRITEPSDRLVVAAILVKVLVPEGGDPILALSGYAGSGKTTTANYIRSLIDPFTKGKVLAKIPDTDHLAIHGRKRRIIAIDNLSHITADQSNILCGVSTKSSTSKRKLFSDGEEVLIDLANLIILTSVGNVVNKSDLLSRSINIELSKLTDEDRSSESSLNNDFDQYHGDMLGGLVNMAVFALNYRDTTESPTFSRMTEFIHLGEGVEKFFKYPSETLLKRIKWGESEANTIAIESSPTASILVNWFEGKDKWEGLTNDLLNILKSHAKKLDQAGALPKNAIKLSAELRMVESALLEVGIEISTKRKNTGMYVNVTRVKIGGNLSTPIYTPPNPFVSDGFRGVDKGVDKNNLSTPSNLSTPFLDPDRVDRMKGVDKNNLSAPLSTPLEPLLDIAHSDRVDSVDKTPPISGGVNTNIDDDEDPYIDGDV